MAKQRRPRELAHQRVRKFIKSVGQNNHFVVFAQRVKKSARAGQRGHFANHLLNIRQTQAVFGQNAQAIFHQYVVIGFIARRAPQGVNPRAFGKRNPDFGDQNALKVKANNFHKKLPATRKGRLKMGGILAWRSLTPLLRLLAARVIAADF